MPDRDGQELIVRRDRDNIFFARGGVFFLPTSQALASNTQAHIATQSISDIELLIFTCIFFIFNDLSLYRLRNLRHILRDRRAYTYISYQTFRAISIGFGKIFLQYLHKNMDNSQNGHNFYAPVDKGLRI